MSYFGVVIPTKNEADTIGDLVKACDKFADAVYVLDCSEEADTFYAAQQAGAMLPPCPPDGLRGAYRKGNERIPSDWYVGHIDAGGSHDPQDLVDMMDIAVEGKIDLVIGDRFGIGAEYHGKWSRYVTSQLAATMMNLVTRGADYADWTSGLRVYSPRARALLAKHDFACQGHAWQMESLRVLHEAGMRIVEFPIVYERSRSHLSGARVREAFRYWRSCLR